MRFATPWIAYHCCLIAPIGRVKYSSSFASRAINGYLGCHSNGCL